MSRRIAEQLCENCVFWRRDFTSSEIGECRRHSPDAQFDWPRVSTDDWCGEYGDKANYE